MKAMNPIPPFVANNTDDAHCVNAVYRMLFLHYFHKNYTWRQIDRLTRSENGKGTWTVPGDIELAKRGLLVRNIEPVDYERLFSEGVTYLHRIFGKQTAEYYLTHSNIASVIKDIPLFLRLVRHETRKATAEEILSLLKGNNLIAATVNSSVLNEHPGFALHMILIYGFDGTCLHIHDPGLPPHASRQITIKQFEASFDYPGGNGGIEVFHE